MSNRFRPPSDEELAARGITVEKVRARNDDGTLKADDPATPDVNEAWVEKPVAKKTTRKPRKKAESK